MRQRLFKINKSQDLNWNVFFCCCDLIIVSITRVNRLVYKKCSHNEHIILLSWKKESYEKIWKKTHFSIFRRFNVCWWPIALRMSTRAIISTKQYSSFFCYVSLHLRLSFTFSFFYHFEYMISFISLLYWVSGHLPNFFSSHLHIIYWIYFFHSSNIYIC